MATESRCTEYVERWVKISFTGDTVRCDQCPLLETYSRRQCRLTAEYLANGYLTGRLCPLVEEPNTYLDPYTGELFDLEEKEK